ncbi:unnamed protein product [Adineta ricciae]|uniref:Uncharacterized protein n=1 Tax=Adineta ricciae TaxID=249248 RepID=A0A815WLG4_ADIRI|nr:unnamed protein product [Adineta ricciae]CAF1602873.1 unnamed protein product [Adineta ricciae]
MSPEKVKALPKAYIYTVVDRYRGKSQWWNVNEYKIESGGLKAEKTLTSIKWLKCEKIPIHDLGMQWTYSNGTVQVDSGNCNDTNKKWNVTWLGDGTSRLSPQNNANYALDAYTTTASIGGAQTRNWSGDFTQEWFTKTQENSTYFIALRNAWWRIFTVFETSKIGMVNRIYGDLQCWILIIV